MFVKEGPRFIGPPPSMEVHVDSSGRVFWAQDWRRMDALTAAGHLTRKFYGPATYGHVDYFVKE